MNDPTACVVTTLADEVVDTAFSVLDPVFPKEGKLIGIVSCDDLLQRLKGTRS